MQAIQIHEFGDAKQLSFADGPVPEPKAGEIRVKVAATGLNFVEIYQRKGLYPGQRPFTPGAEFSGTIDALGQGVTGFQVGDQVVTASGSGGYAEYALAPADKTVHIPPGISMEIAAAVMLQGMTAHYLTLSTYPLKSGESALIHAAASGVGQLLVQIARKCGARVIATASTSEKLQIALELGANELIDYSTADFENEVKRLTEGKGVDVVYDGVGKTTFLKSLNCLKPRGYMVLYGQASGPVDPINPQLLNQKGALFLTRPTLAYYIQTREELNKRAGDLWAWIAAGELRVRIDRKFPLKEAAAAHEYMENRSTKGKVLLMPSPGEAAGR
jgi:NADPH:quinone reductase